MRVQCNVYDITQGMARTMSMMLIGKQVDIIPHTGIVFGGKEYFFGGGICESPNPGNCIPLRPCQTLDLGETRKTPGELESWLATQHGQWNQNTYNLLKHNCNHFANTVAKFLGVNELPSSILNIAEEALSTPRGAQIRQLIEQFDRQMQQSSASMNPFSNVQSASAAPAAPVTQELEAPLAEIAKASVETRRACLSTLLTIAKNASNLSDPKFQKVKMENPAFNKKVCDCAGGTDAMLAIGFLPDTQDGIDYWVMQPSCHGMLAVNINRLTTELAKLPAAPLPRQNEPASSPPGMNPQMMAQAPSPPGMNPQMMGQAQQMMQNPQMMAQMQQMMQNNPQMMQQAQQMMNDPAAMQRLMQQMQGRPPF